MGLSIKQVRFLKEELDAMNEKIVSLQKALSESEKIVADLVKYVEIAEHNFDTLENYNFFKTIGLYIMSIQTKKRDAVALTIPLPTDVEFLKQENLKRKQEIVDNILDDDRQDEVAKQIALKGDRIYAELSLTANNAQTAANAAMGAATTAQNTATTAQGMATTAINAAATAENAANAAVIAANAAEDTANEAVSTAYKAEDTASEAINAANAAVSTATTAQNTATTAQSTAYTAQNTATTAQNTATTAQNTATTAQNTATTAQGKAQMLATDLAALDAVAEYNFAQLEGKGYLQPLAIVISRQLTMGVEAQLNVPFDVFNGKTVKVSKTSTGEVYFTVALGQAFTHSLPMGDLLVSYTPEQGIDLLNLGQGINITLTA